MNNDNSLNMSSAHPTYSDGSTAVDGEFPPAMPKQKPPLQEISFIRRGKLLFNEIIFLCELKSLLFFF